MRSYGFSLSSYSVSAPDVFPTSGVKGPPSFIEKGFHLFSFIRVFPSEYSKVVLFLDKYAIFTGTTSTGSVDVYSY